MTIGPNVLIHGQNGVIGVNTSQLGGFSDGTFTIQGTVDADVSGGSIQLNGVNWTNASSGLIEAAGGASVNLAGSWTNNGTITGAANSTLNLGSGGAWTNNGPITAAANSTVNLGGTFAIAGLGSFSASGATVNIVGTLTNTGSTLALTNTSGAWHLLGGTINGGTVTTTGGNALFATSSGGTLANGVTLNGVLDLDNSRRRPCRRHRRTHSGRQRHSGSRQQCEQLRLRQLQRRQPDTGRQRQRPLWHLPLATRFGPVRVPAPT